MEAQPLAYQIHKRKAKKWYANASMPEGKIKEIDPLQDRIGLLLFGEEL